MNLSREFLLEPWDPFMTYHESTEEIVTEKFSDSRISITPYILPHMRKCQNKRGKTHKVLAVGLFSKVSMFTGTKG